MLASSTRDHDVSPIKPCVHSKASRLLATVLASAVFSAPLTTLAQDLGATGEAPLVEAHPALGELLTRAAEHYWKADYAVVLTLLTEILDDSARLQDEDPSLQLEALRLVALSHILKPSPDSAKARTYLARILVLDSNFELSEGIDPAPALQILKELKKDRTTEIPQGAASVVYVQKEVVERLYWVSFVPFGAGQAQNGDSGKAVFFLITQGLALGVNAFSYLFVEGLRNSDGFFTETTKETAEQFRVAQFTSLGVLLGLMAWSIGDALYFYAPQSVDIYKLDGPPPELVDPMPRVSASLLGEDSIEGATLDLTWFTW